MNFVRASPIARPRNALADGPKVRGVNLGGWLVLEVRSRLIVPFHTFKAAPLAGANAFSYILTCTFCTQPWITPSIFDNTGNDGIVDEYTFGELFDSNQGKTILENHWNTWITESDFEAIAGAG